MTSSKSADPRLLEFVATQRWGVLATVKRDGRPQLSNVGYAWDDGLVRVSVTADPPRRATWSATLGSPCTSRPRTSGRGWRWKERPS
ncbi:pyridoxamine 5'-phosphate oxidase family protein, partial [Blastococcus saxobsidens]|uniref:Pyridoxamine 5'-phosphate oxidase n=1 Tax=Blastococcus saxobsidens (strain DD2) TaxID=1146883 RepID=H6RNY8_BLASD